MPRPLRVLLLEDSEPDAMLIARVLKRHEAGIDLERVDTLERLAAALDEREWDMVISDYQLDGFTGLDALALTRARSEGLPLILVSATIGEEVAVEAMRGGANDYVMKNNLARLLPAVQRETREFQSRRREAEVQRLQQERISRLSRVKAVMSAINAMMVRVRDREELFRETCRIAVEAGRFQMAWIAVRTRTASLEAFTHWAVPAPLYRVLSVALERGALADDPLARALRERVGATSNDVEDDPRVESRGELLSHGVRSLAALPLLAAGVVDAVLILHAAEPGFFDDDEMRLLEELAGDIGYALDQIRKQERLDYLAFYDALTALPNRTLFGELLTQRIHDALGDGRRFAVLVADLDRFRTVNDSLGRQVGDALLQQVGSRLATCGAPGHVARIGADNFAILLPAARDAGEIARFVRERVEPAFDAPFQIQQTDLRIAARVGIALYPEDGTSADVLLRNADAAAARAKGGGERFLFYGPQMTTRVAEAFLLENQLRQALASGEFLLHYQPKVDVARRSIVAVEALIRWRSPQLGLVSPAQFIPVLEETGMIVEVGHWVLRQAVGDHLRWVEMGLAAPPVAVNVSVCQLRRDDFAESVGAALASGASPPGIEMEIVESLAMQDIETSIAKLDALRALGVTLAIDDFGTGYSSLGYLARLPVQALKIDLSFVRAMLDDPHAATLVATMISLAHSLGLRVVAEGVETEAQALALEALGCDQLQGYLTGRPMPWDELTALLSRPPHASASGFSR